MDFVVVRKDSQPYCCFFMGLRKGWRHWLFYKTRAYLNETGIAEIDDLVIEYNGVHGPVEELDWFELLASGEFDDIEEVYFNNVTHETFLKLPKVSEFFQRRSRHLDCHYVDLKQIRESGKSHLAFLSSSKRRQIQKSLAFYEEAGSIKVREALSVEEALAAMGRLSELHQTRWAQKGSAGAFSSKYFRRFHEALIATRFAAGEIQVLEFRNAKGAIGYLYNFVQGAQVFFYQSGFVFESKQNNRARPGLVCHHLAIEYNLAKGHDIYNFLAGDSQYKRSLATHKDQLHSVLVARNNYKWKLENALLNIKKALSKGG